MRCGLTQEHLEGVSQTLNQILHLRLEDESDVDARLEKYRSVTPKSVMQNFNRTFTEKLKRSLVQDGTND